MFWPVFYLTFYFVFCKIYYIINVINRAEGCPYLSSGISLEVKKNIIMPVEVKRKPNENTYGLLSRFKDKVRKGRILSLTKQSMYFQKKKNRLQKKKDALRRLEKTAKRDFLIKTGQMEENGK